MRGIARLLLAAAVAAGCAHTPMRPSVDPPVRVTISPLPLPPSLGAAIGFTGMVQNVTTSAVTLTFPSSCRLLPYFVDRRTGGPVTPRGGGFACAAMIGQLTLQPGMSDAQVFMVKAGDAPEPNVIVLPPGDYAISVRLEDQVFRAESPRLAFSVR